MYTSKVTYSGMDLLYGINNMHFVIFYISDYIWLNKNSILWPLLFSVTVHQVSYYPIVWESPTCPLLICGFENLY